jgi:hypothetical protein
VCGCLILLLGSFAPRLALAIIWLINDEITEAFDGSILIPLVGFFLLPYTTLTWVLFNWFTGDVEGFDLFVVAFAFVVDIGSYIGGWSRRHEARSYRPTRL